MNGRTWPLRWVGPLLIAAAPTNAAPPAGPVDLPSIELLEYLAEFEPAEDGRLLDPLDMQRAPRDEDRVSAQDKPRSTTR